MTPEPFADNRSPAAASSVETSRAGSSQRARAELVARRQPALLRLSALFVGVAILALGNGLAGTLLGVRGGLEGMSAESIGLFMSAFFFGYVLSSFWSPGLIQTVGHIRTFAALASIASAVALAYAIFVSVPVWTALRIVHGACYAGLVMVVESWLNASTARRRRGRVLAVYNVVLLGAWIASQPLLAVAAPAGFVLFCIVSICLSLALVPITLTRAGVPGVVAASRAGLPQLYRMSPMGLAGVFAGALAMSAIWGMGPRFAQDLGLGETGIAAFMSTSMLGALVLQWPLGWLSDVVDRRHVVIGASLCGALLAAGVTMSLGQPLAVLLALVFLFGGVTIPLYPLSVAHVNDHIDQHDLLAAASGLVMLYGAGASLGPFGASLLMGQIGAPGLFAFSGAVLALFTVYGLFRLTRRRAVRAEDKQSFVAVPSTTHAAVQMHKHRTGRGAGARAPE